MTRTEVIQELQLMKFNDIYLRRTASKTMQDFARIFDGVEDPRTSNAARNKLHEILMIALLCVICGGQTCTNMVLFGRSKEQFLRSFMPLELSIMRERYIVIIQPVITFQNSIWRNCATSTQNRMRNPSKWRKSEMIF